MKREGTIGAAAFLALAAVVGISVQQGPKPAESGRTDRGAETKRAKPPITTKETDNIKPGCRSLQGELREFLRVDTLALPPHCYEGGGTGSDKSPRDLSKTTSELKFVIAMMPDPVHTHLATLFDQFAVSIQQGAQDEKYDFDESWFPWDEESSSYALLADEKAANREKQMKEDQPGIILFRKTLECPEEELKGDRCNSEFSKLYPKGLIVFVVGEEATHGIHREQFYNALEWITTLQQRAEINWKQLAVLGPTFSGSLPSVAEVLSKIKAPLELQQNRTKQKLAIFSGSVSSNISASVFQHTFNDQIVFHSFVQSDDEILRRFCNYIMREQSGFDPSKMAIISEDETAYGGSGIDSSGGAACPNDALRLFYPRDISALRGAYQAKSLFDLGTSSQSADTQKRNLPTDLADPAGRVHDSIHNYGGNQTPLAQEAYLLEIVAALRELHARYILLRSSNTLDQLFLTNFLRRAYPNGRIVIFGSDLMFIRERGATGLSGAMTLSTFPLFPLERDWTEHQSLTAADRTFTGDNPEGVYVALRLLLNDGSIYNGEPDRNRCSVLEPERAEEYRIFLPRVSCTNNSPMRESSAPIPDYSPPFWTLFDQCGELKYPSGDEKCSCPAIANTGEKCPYPGPATWLSVIGVNRFWPVASLTQQTPNAPPVDERTAECATDRGKEAGGRPEVPLGMKVFWIILVGFSAFHAWCCWSGSFTGRPPFRAHFASTGEWRHRLLVFFGSCCVAFLAIVAAWGCGVFWNPTGGLEYPWFAAGCATLVCVIALVAILGNNYTAKELSKGLPNRPNLARMTKEDFRIWNYRASGLFVVAVGLFYLVFINPLEKMLVTENRVLTYWRAMHLASGVSPVVPMFSILAGLYLSFWFTLHGLALFGPDRPCLPPRRRLFLQDEAKNIKEFLRMFSEEDAARTIEDAARPLNWKVAAVGAILFAVFLGATFGISRGVPVRSLGAQSYATIFVLWLNACCTMAIVEAWRFNKTWEELKRLLTFLDRLPLRRTLALLHGFSWGSVWKMSGNVLEVRYKVISRQMECMNHTISGLEEFLKEAHSLEAMQGPKRSLAALVRMRTAGIKFADWYSTNYKIDRAGDLRSFRAFQKIAAAASGTLLTKLLVPAWRQEKESLVVVATKPNEEKEDTSPAKPLQAKEGYIRNAEEFVCLTYLGFIQNVLGRLRTMALTIMVVSLAATVATSTYPFDPRQALSAILIALFVITGAVIVKVYADMHRDATLSHVTNTKPGELGAEFWLKIIGFGFAPLVGLLTRIFPGMTDFVFSWLQPGVSSLK
jgi:hypothetical protein